MEQRPKLLANLRGTTRVKVDTKLEALSQRLESSPPALWQIVQALKISWAKRDQSSLKRSLSKRPIVSFEPEENSERNGAFLDGSRGFCPSVKRKKPESEET